MATPVIGLDAIPHAVRNSKVLSATDLEQLGSVAALPSDEEIAAYTQREEIKDLFDATIGDTQTRDLQLHLKAKQLLATGRTDEAWMVLLAE
ncbi:hypothetical protein FPZ43_10650 [Mucilaginibacter pallidiroseus]|uniref:Uncharacterized protein n=1 Tax=Mucilaginibacter pallidiroseus TaxID=2599295 RepID=A0A563UDD7_9SPHI|nr:hypothetical protein [Mucilaginibacter pallidiroseus]TWR29402.1 hypothetical protein FPZ43_10650 [Mucilaginibacter pallidiroseus]